MPAVPRNRGAGAGAGGGAVCDRRPRRQWKPRPRAASSLCERGLSAQPCGGRDAGRAAACPPVREGLVHHVWKSGSKSIATGALSFPDSVHGGLCLLRAARAHVLPTTRKCSLNAGRVRAVGQTARFRVVCRSPRALHPDAGPGGGVAAANPTLKAGDECTLHSSGFRACYHCPREKRKENSPGNGVTCV